MQTNNLTLAKTLGGLFIFLTVFTACKKDPVQNPIPQPTTKELVVQFSNTGISVTEIDSVVVIIRDQNLDIKKWKTIERRASSFNLNLEGLPDCTYSTQILAYTKKRADFTARQFALSKNISMPLQQSVVVNAPNGTFNDSWYQRIVFFESQHEAVIIVAMDPRDSYYEASFKAARWKRVHLQRSAINGNVLVASKTSSRNIEGLIGFSEYGDFIPYVENMNGKDWTKASINGYIEQQGGGDIGFAYDYNK